MEIYHCKCTTFGMEINACVSAECETAALVLFGWESLEIHKNIEVKEVGSSCIDAKVIAEECL